ncbi:MAG TPA: hypothetical protein VKS21_00200, partial [Spirochaetota bacterium]|nr:hypothetical protein [Spirochaetota bacterium]
MKKIISAFLLLSTLYGFDKVFSGGSWSIRHDGSPRNGEHVYGPVNTVSGRWNGDLGQEGGPELPVWWITNHPAGPYPTTGWWEGLLTMHPLRGPIQDEHPVLNPTAPIPAGHPTGVVTYPFTFRHRADPNERYGMAVNVGGSGAFGAYNSWDYEYVTGRYEGHVAEVPYDPASANHEWTHRNPDEEGIGTIFEHDIYIRTHNMKKTDSTYPYWDPPGTNYHYVRDWGDFHVELLYTDNEGHSFEMTMVKGSPFFYLEKITDPDGLELYFKTGISHIYDSNGNSVITEPGDWITADRIHLDSAPALWKTNGYDSGPMNLDWGLYAAPGTVFSNAGTNSYGICELRVYTPAGKNYLSCGLLYKESYFDLYYEYAYAFVNDTSVSWDFDQSVMEVSTTLSAQTELKRANKSRVPVLGMLPHHWKNADAAPLEPGFFTIMGWLKPYIGKAFTT